MRTAGSPSGRNKKQVLSTDKGASMAPHEFRLNTGAQGSLFGDAQFTQVWIPMRSTDEPPGRSPGFALVELRAKPTNHRRHLRFEQSMFGRKFGNRPSDPPPNCRYPIAPRGTPGQHTNSCRYGAIHLTKPLGAYPTETCPPTHGRTSHEGSAIVAEGCLFLNAIGLGRPG